ncbi:MAG: DMT family transporter [Candidatus Zixiibacteriota bacterium]
MSDSKNIRNISSHIGLIYAAAIWGSTFIIVKASLDNIDPVILVGYRFTFAALVLAGFLIYKRKPLFAQIGRGCVLGFFLWMLYVPQTIGLGYTTASNSAFITGLFVAFVPLFSLLLFKKKPAIRDYLAVTISLAGLWFLTGGLVNANLGDMLTLITAMTYGLHILLVGKYAKFGFDPYLMAFQQFLFVGVASLIAGVVFQLPFGIGTTETAIAVLFLALLPTLSAFVIQMVAQKIVPPVRVSLIFALEPVFAALFAWTVGGEEFFTYRAIGGLLIVAAMIVSAIPYRRFVVRRAHM